MDAGDWDDVDDFDGAEFSGPLGNGPIDASRRVVTGLDGWIQRIRVFHVDPFDVNEERPHFSTDLVQVEVIVLYQAPDGRMISVELERMAFAINLKCYLLPTHMIIAHFPWLL